MFDTGLSLHSRQKDSQRKFLFVQNMNFQEETSGDAQSPISSGMSMEPEHSSGTEVRYLITYTGRQCLEFKLKAEASFMYKT